MALKPVIRTTSASFTRPADTTTYASGDLMANSTTAASVTPMAFTLEVGYGRGIKITAVKLQTDSAGPNAAFTRLHLYTSEPTSTNGDNGVYGTTLSGYIGFFSLDDLVDFSDGICSVTRLAADEQFVWYLETGTTIYGLLEARDAYVPESGEVFTVTLVVEHY